MVLVTLFALLSRRRTTAAEQGEKRHQDHGTPGSRGNRRKSEDRSVDGACCRQHVASNDDQRCLHRERNEVPEPKAPRVHNLQRRRTGGDRRNDYDKCGQKREDEGVGSTARSRRSCRWPFEPTVRIAVTAAAAGRAARFLHRDCSARV